MAHTLIHDRHMLGLMMQACEAAPKEKYDKLAEFEYFGWFLLRLWHSDRITFFGITDKGWQELEGLYEWMIESEIMEPIF